jgi:hypothetical protein
MSGESALLFLPDSYPLHYLIYAPGFSGRVEKIALLVAAVILIQTLCAPHLA